jgi:hypothetical protein
MSIEEKTISLKNNRCEWCERNFQTSRLYETHRVSLFRTKVQEHTVRCLTDSEMEQKGYILRTLPMKISQGVTIDVDTWVKPGYVERVRTRAHHLVDHKDEYLQKRKEKQAEQRQDDEEMKRW